MAIWWGGGHPRGTEHDRAPAKTWRSRALQLQSQWQEVTERERRARVRNQQLLEDFERAQDTLRDLAARTAAMATIRMEYEKQLEQHFPQWQQRFEEKRISVQHKEVALHLKEALRKMEEERDREAHRRTTKGVNAPRLSPGPSLLPTTPILPHSLTVSEKGETHLHMLQKNKKTTKKNSVQSYPYTPWRPSVHSSWLTEAQSSPDVSQAGYIQDPRSPPDLGGLQDLARAGHPFQHPLHRLVSQPFDPCWLLPQEQPHRGPIVGYPPGWPGLCSVPRLQPPYSQVPWPGFPIVDPRDWGMALPHEPDAKGDSATTRGERERGEGPETVKDSRQGQQGYKRPLRASNQSYELDIKPVRLSSSQGSSVCSEAPQGDAAGVRRRRRRENKGGMPQSRMNSEEAASQRSSAGSSVSSPTGSGVVRATDLRATFEARSQRSGRPLATAPSIQQEKNHSQEEASESAGAETEGAVNQGTEDGQETQDSSQRDGGITDEEDEDGEEEGEDEKEDDEEEEVENKEAEEEREGERIEDSDVEQEVHEGEEGSGDEGSIEGEVSSCSEDADAEKTGGVLEQAEVVVEVGKRLKLSAKEVGEEDPSSERTGNSEEEEETEGELEVEVKESIGSEEEEQEDGHEEEEDEEEEADKQESCNQEENGEDEGEGSGSLEEGETEEGEESEEGNDVVEEDEEDDDEEEGTGGAEAAADNRKEESEGSTDSEDEIITSQVDRRTRKADVGMRCKTRAGGNMGDIEEEGEDEDSEQIDGYKDDSENGDYIEGLLAPKKDSSIHQVCVAEKKESPDPASPIDREPKEKPTCPQRVKEQIVTVKSKALWQDSDSDLEDNVPGRSDVTMPLKDVLEDFDEFYD